MFPDCRTVLRRTLVLPGLEGSSGIVKPRDNNYPLLLSATEKIFRLKRASASQLESNIRKKLNPVEADNIVLAASRQNG
jgi:alkylhydroperoxidase family enzyme